MTPVCISGRVTVWFTDDAPERANHVWADDFVKDRTRDRRKIRMLNVVEPKGSPEVDEFTRECLCIWGGCKLGSSDVIDVLADLFIARGTPGFICSDSRARCRPRWSSRSGCR